MRKNTVLKITTGICYGILFLFFLTIVLRLFTRVIVVERLQVENNAFVNALFFDQEQLTSTKNGGTFRINEEGENTAEDNTDWASLYPFEQTDEPVKISPLEKLENKIASAEAPAVSIMEKLSVYSTDFLMGRQYFVGEMNKMERAIGWNLGSYNEYNAVVTLDNGRLSEYIPKRDITENAKSLIQLKKFCNGLGCDFLYIQSPYDICKEENKNVSGILDFSNQNADNLLALAKKSGVECLDMRKHLHKDGLNHADAFYRTDHHWKAETGLWAARNLSEYLNETHGFSIDISMLLPEQFDYEIYPSWFLGSRGSKLTADVVPAEDFTMIYPKYQTKLHYEIPGSGIDEIGDFLVTYDMERAATTGGYSPENSYSVYNHGDCAVNILTNLQGSGKKILIIKDSFTEVVNPFLACADGVGEVDVLDVRHFTGSVQAFIREKQPDIVIVWYNPSSISEINWGEHKNTFDFR